MKPRLPQLVERITTQIQGEVSAYAGPRSGRRRRLIERAVTSAVHHFVGIIEGHPGPGHGVDELFRRMGRGEALDSMATACRPCARPTASPPATHGPSSTSLH